VKAIILAGGFATRLRPLTLTKPKPLLPILDRPLLDWILDSLARAGIKDAILSVRYLSNIIKEQYKKRNDLNLNLYYAEEPWPLGDAGPIRFIYERFGLDETFLVIYGDIFTDINFKQVVDYHKERGSLATLVLAKVEDPSRYGVVILDENYKIVQFIEKPPRGRAPSNLVNAGIYIFEPEVLKYIPDKYPSKLARDVIPKLVRDKVVYGYKHDGLWSDIGVPEDYLRANICALQMFHPNGFIASNSEIPENVDIINPVFIGSNVKIGVESIIGPNTILCNNIRVGNYTRIENSIVFSNTIIEDAAVIQGSIIGEGCHISKWVRIETDSVMGDSTIVDENIYIARKTIVLPFKEINESIFKEGQVIL